MEDSLPVPPQAPLPELRNGLLVSYSISYREFDPMGKAVSGWHHMRISATQGAPSITLRHLKPSTQYSVMVQALTLAGAGPGATAPLCLTQEEGEFGKRPTGHILNSCISLGHCISLCLQLSPLHQRQQLTPRLLQSQDGQTPPQQVQSLVVITKEYFTLPQVYSYNVFHCGSRLNMYFDCILNHGRRSSRMKGWQK